MIYASKDPAQVLLLPELRDLLDAYPTRFRLRHCLSRQGSTHLAASIRMGGMPERQPPPGESNTQGRVNSHVLLEEFDGPWADGEPVEHFLLVGSSAIETAVLNMVFEAGLRDPAQIRGHPDFLLMKGPRGQNTKWLPLAGEIRGLHIGALRPEQPGQQASDAPNDLIIEFSTAAGPQQERVDDGQVHYLSMLDCVQEVFSSMGNTHWGTVNTVI